MNDFSRYSILLIVMHVAVCSVFSQFTGGGHGATPVSKNLPYSSCYSFAINGFSGNDKSGFSTSLLLVSACQSASATPFIGGTGDGSSLTKNLQSICESFAINGFAGNQGSGYADFTFGTLCSSSSATPYVGGSGDGSSLTENLQSICESFAINGFAGGQGGGYTDFTFGTVCLSTATNIYAGASGDGSSVTSNLLAVCYPYAINGFAGANEDGYSSGILFNNTCSSMFTNPYAGGIADGSSFVVNLQSACEPYTINGFMGSQGGGFSQYALDLDFSLCNYNVALPISVIKFDATPQDDKVKIDWITSSERDNDYFTIEKSINGYDWELLDHVSGAGNSISEIKYFTYDYNPVVGIQYYKLSQTDFDGMVNYHPEIRSVYFSVDNWLLYPNPSSAIFYIKNQEVSLKGVSISILDIQGKLIYFNSDFEDDEFQFNLEEYSDGMYFIQVKKDKEIKSFKVIKK